MKIDGKLIAQEILQDLAARVTKLKEKNITPHLVVILVGNDPASESYVKQKLLKTESIGGVATLQQFTADVTQEKLVTTIEQLNTDSNIHGIIVQLPLPKHLNTEVIDQKVTVEKDIDGFCTNSPFPMPLALAVMKIIEKTGTDVSSKNIVIVGKGKTGGGPIIQLLQKRGLTPAIIDSKTQNPENITKQADIIVTTVGRENVVTKDMIKKGVILVGVGMHKGQDGKLHGDYDEGDIQDTASHYTPIPGGVGPVNVAMLLENLVVAAEKRS